MSYEIFVRVLIGTMTAMLQISVALLSRKCGSSFCELQLTKSANISFHDLILISKAKSIS
jgi:hypothetical protein